MLRLTPIPMALSLVLGGLTLALLWRIDRAGQLPTTGHRLLQGATILWVLALVAGLVAALE